jgi:Iron/zinc purple acid phosphatase-like protein C
MIVYCCVHTHTTHTNTTNRDNTSFGHGLLRVLDDSTAEWEWHSNDIASETMNIKDSVTVINPYKASKHA